jgi:hypothetical protein
MLFPILQPHGTGNQDTAVFQLFFSFRRNRKLEGPERSRDKYPENWLLTK